MKRDFKVVQKGVMGKHSDQPFIRLKSASGDSLIIRLDDKSQLQSYDIDDEFTVNVAPTEQQRLPAVQA